MHTRKNQKRHKIIVIMEFVRIVMDYLAQVVNQIHSFGGHLFGIGVVLMLPYIVWYSILLRKLKKNNYSDNIPKIIKKRKKQSLIRYVEYLSYTFIIIGIVLIIFGPIIHNLFSCWNQTLPGKICFMAGIQTTLKIMSKRLSKRKHQQTILE